MTQDESGSSSARPDREADRPASRKNGRPRGYAPWSPHRRTRALLAAVGDEVLDAYAEHLPLTVRQVFYVLVGIDSVEKTERG